jgi:hypothetical protein
MEAKASKAKSKRSVSLLVDLWIKRFEYLGKGISIPDRNDLLDHCSNGTISRTKVKNLKFTSYPQVGEHPQLGTQTPDSDRNFAAIFAVGKSM